MFPKVSIGIILYKAEKYLPYTLKSLAEQNYENIEFLFRDQSPNGEAYEYIQKNLPEYLKIFHIEKGGNRMHSGGHNDLINKMTGGYYICASNDMYYPKDFVLKLVSILEKEENKKFGSATVKLMRWDFDSITNEKLKIKNESYENTEDRILKNSFTSIIDSCGIGIKQTHHFYDRGQGEEDHGQYDKQKSIFGGSGALVVLKKSALNAIVFTNEQGKKEYFDELIHYKNDVDLAYRLQWASQKCLFISEIQVWHDRQVSSKAQGIIGILQSRSDKNKWAKENSYFGHQLVLLKNYSSDFSLKVRLKTSVYNFISLLFILFFERYLLKQLDVIQEKMPFILKRKEAMKKSVLAKEIERFMK